MGKGQVAERVKVLAHKVEAMAVVPAMAALILWRRMKEVVLRPIAMVHQQVKEVVRP